MISRWAVAFLCAAPFAALAQISPCGSGQQLGNNAVITSGNAVYSSPGYVSAGSLSVNVVGTSVAGNGSVTIKAGTAICLGPGFKAAATSNGGGFTALIGTTPPAGAFAVTTASLVGANQGASYQQTLNASGGIPSYTWSQAGGSLPPGLSLNSAGVIAGTAAVSGTYVFVAQVHDAAGATATQTLSITVASVNPPSLSINGGSGNGETLATVTVPLVFALYDSAGANDIGYAQFYLADSAGNVHCYGEWGRQNALFLYDGNTGLTDGFGIDQSDSFCTVSLQSITNSSSDPTETTVVLNFTFNQGFAGAYSVMEQVDYVSGTGTSWQNVGTLTIESPPTLSSQPTVTLTDNTQNSGYYLAGDSFTLTVMGPPNQPVGVSINGIGYGTQGYTNSSGVHSINGSWSNANVGSYLENWYVESVATPSLTFQVEAQVPVTSQPVTQSAPGSAPVAQAIPVVSGSTQNCNDISGTWTDVQSDVYTLSQTGQSVTGTISEPDPYCSSPIAWTVQGSSTSPGSFSLTEFGPAFDACSNPVALPTFSVNISITSCSAAQETVGSSPGSNPSFSQLAMPLATGTTAYWARLSPPPGLTMTVDLLNDRVGLVLANQNKTGTLNVVLNGTTASSPNTTTTTMIANTTNASYLLTPTYSLQRTTLSPGQYSSVVATWDDISLTIPVAFYVLGNTRFTQYNTPYGSQCGANPQIAHIINAITADSCGWQDVALGSAFISRVAKPAGGTGTGVVQLNGVNQIVKSYAAGARNICPLPPGANTDGSNTFFSVDTGGHSITKITGTHNTVLSDGTAGASPLNNNNPQPGSVAVLPANRQPAAPFSFGDQILLIDQSNNNDSLGPRSVEDLCPACVTGSFTAPAVAHIDMYSSNQACSGVTDYGNHTVIRLR